MRILGKDACTKSSSGGLTVVTALVLWGLAAAGAPARADEQTTPPAGGAGEATSTGGGLQEVVVTATRREESLSRVPISVTALTGEDMDVRGLKDFQDIVRFTPGVSIDTTGTNNISIRGISSSAGAGTTGIYIDDTPIQMRDVGFSPDDTLPKTFDLARVEVLRGPQGTLFGSGSEGGTVRYILTEPSLTSASTYGRGEVSYTQYGQPNYELGLAHGGPIIDGTLGFRVSAWYRYDGGWINRVDPTTGEQVESNANYQNTAMFRLAFIWAPASSLTVEPSVIYQDSKKRNESTFWPSYSNPGDGVFNTATPELMPVDDKWYLPALKVRWDLGKSEIIADASYYHRDELTAYQGTVYDLGFFQLLGWPTNPLTGGLGCGSASTTPNPPCSWYPLLDGNGIHLPAGFENFQTPNQMTNTQRSYVGELRWQSSDPSARFKWTVGLFWQEAKEGSIEELKDPNNQINPFFNALFGQSATDTFGPYYSCPTNVAYPYIPACDIYYLNNQTIDKQFAGYGEVSYNFTDQWRLTVGERISHTTFNISSYSDGLENYGPINTTPLVPRTGQSSETPNTPKASLSFQMDQNNLFYATYAKGFRVGGGNPPLPSYCNADLLAETGLTSAPTTYGSDSTQNYEIGSKNLIAGNVRLASSVYYIKWNDIQQSIYVAGSCGLQFIDNVGTAVSKGFDLQADMAFDPVYLDMAVGYTDARFSKDSPLVSSTGQPLVRNGNAISGQAVINGAPGTIPPWDLAIGAEYRFHPWQHDAFVRVDWTYQSKNPWLAAIQDPKTAQFVPGQTPAVYTPPATSFTSLRAGVTLGDWQVSAFMDNVFDSHTVLNYQMSQFDSYAYGPPALVSPVPTVQQNQYTYRPRTIGITATWRIGH